MVFYISIFLSVSRRVVLVLTTIKTDRVARALNGASHREKTAFRFPLGAVGSTISSLHQRRRLVER